VERALACPEPFDVAAQTAMANPKHFPREGREVRATTSLYGHVSGTTPLHNVEVLKVLKKVLAVATLAGALSSGAALAAAPAQASVFCAHASVTVNDTNQTQDICTPV
jgi:hypothetical protein